MTPSAKACCRAARTGKSAALNAVTLLGISTGMNLLRSLLLLPALLFTCNAQARDWYSAGHGDVDTRAFVVQVREEQVRALLPAPLTLNTEFPGKQSGTHPLVFLFSHVMPRKAHLMPILIDIPYREFAVFIPEVMHPELKGVFIQRLIRRSMSFR
jgi:hypothetical protein